MFAGFDTCDGAGVCQHSGGKDNEWRQHIFIFLQILVQMVEHAKISVMRKWITVLLPMELWWLMTSSAMEKNIVMEQETLFILEILVSTIQISVRKREYFSETETH